MVRPSCGKTGHGGAAAQWRANVKSLKDFWYPEVDMSIFLNNLSLWAEKTWKVPRSQWETHRQYLGKVHQKVCGGLGMGHGWLAVMNKWAG